MGRSYRLVMKKKKEKKKRKKRKTGKTVHIWLSKIKKYKHAYSNKDSQDNAIPSSLIAYPLYQPIDTGDLTCSTNNSSIDAGQRLALQCEALVDSVGLAEDAVDHVVAVIDMAAFLEHVFGFQLGRVIISSITGAGFAIIGGAAVGVNVRSDIR